MTDDPSQTQDPAGGDALAQLEALLAKAKTNRGQASDAAGDLAGGPTAGGVDASGVPAPDPVAEAEAAARAKEEEMQAQIAQSEAERMQALAEQQAAMVQLESTPQYQARVVQGEKQEEEKAAESALHDGHEIIQITETKL